MEATMALDAILLVMGLLLATYVLTGEELPHQLAILFVEMDW